MLDDVRDQSHFISRASATTESRKTTCRTVLTRPHYGGLAPWQIRRVTLYIDVHLSERIKCRELAGLVNLSVRHFTRGFAVSFGRSPHNYFLRKRMEHAKWLIKTTSLTFAQIAIECGMVDQAHFCRTFLRIVGDRPSVWRRNGGRAAHLESTRSPCFTTGSYDSATFSPDQA
jgi:transcriptional regulator GlxA family with amidase domain